MTIEQRLPPFGVVVACARRDELLARVRAGDPTALRLIALAIPTTLPSTVLRAERDARIRAVAAQLHRALPNATSHAIAALIAAAGRRLAEGRQLAGATLEAMLQAEEMAAIEAELRAALRLVATSLERRALAPLATDHQHHRWLMISATSPS
jgi:hypothetical protein